MTWMEELKEMQKLRGMKVNLRVSAAGGGDWHMDRALCEIRVEYGILG